MKGLVPEGLLLGAAGLIFDQTVAWLLSSDSTANPLPFAPMPAAFIRSVRRWKIFRKITHLDTFEISPTHMHPYTSIARDHRVVELSPS